jgi:hypothetical protein
VLRLRDRLCCRAVDLIHSLNEDKDIEGLTTLNNELYVRYQGKDITVYDTQTYNVQRTLQIPNLGAVQDMASCIRHQCIYIADRKNDVIHRVEKEKPITQWPVNDVPHCLSVNSLYNVLVTCHVIGKIKEFTTEGQLVREIYLQADIVHPFHTVELTTDQFVVCHGERGDTLHRVCIVDSDGLVLRSFGNAKGSANGQLNVPVRVVVNGFIFIADMNNHRILMLDPTLSYVREAVTGLGWPQRMWFDVNNGRIYVADKEKRNGEFVASRAKVFNILR